MSTANDREIAFKDWYAKTVKGKENSATSYASRLHNVVGLTSLQSLCKENLFEYDTPEKFAKAINEIVEIDIFVQEDENCDSQISMAFTLYMNFLKYELIEKIILNLRNIKRLRQSEQYQLQDFISLLEEIKCIFSLKEKQKLHKKLPPVDAIKICIENMKVGLIAKSILRCLLLEDIFSYEEVRRLQNRNECSRQFLLSYPVLILPQDEQNYPYDTYYVSPIQIGKTIYKICNDWHEKSKSQLVQYVDNIFMNIILA